MQAPLLLAVPNVSEGRNRASIDAIARAFSSSGARLLDVHSDGDHGRSVLTLAGSPGPLADALLAGVRETLAHVSVVGEAGESSHAGQHPHVGAVDVVPIVYLDDATRGAACAVALLVADRIGSELEVPVFLYGELTSDDAGAGRTRAQLRRGGVRELARRIAGDFASTGDGEDDPERERLLPDFGPARLHPRAGAALVCARPPLVAFNLELAAPATVADAREIAAQLREGAPHGLPGLRAIGIELDGGVAQLSMNVEHALELPLAEVVRAVRERAPVAAAELVGLAPAGALAGFPGDVPMPGFDPARHIIENALGCQ